MRLGDYIKLNSGEEGHVADIGWRSTTIKALSNNLIIIPNSRLAQAIVTNYNLPEKRISFSIPVSVGSDCDPDRIEESSAKRQEGRPEIKGLLAEPAPVVRLIPGFGSSSLDFTLTCHVSEFTEQYPVQHELRKRILKSFRREGIAMPFPSRTVFVREERVKDGSSSAK